MGAVVVLAMACSGAGDCPDGMARIPAGSFRGGVDHPVRAWHQAAYTVELDAYCIDVYEYPNRAGQLPTADVTWTQAAALCAEAGKRLCTSAEWERACRGLERKWHVYEGGHDTTACNTPIDGGGPGTGPLPLAPSGSHPRCVSSEGVYDLGGNLSEWVSDPWDGVPEPFNRQAKPDPATWRTIRGGTMWSGAYYGQDCTSRHGHPKDTWSGGDDGFRCCASGG